MVSNRSPISQSKPVICDYSYRLILAVNSCRPIYSMVDPTIINLDAFEVI
uniref:Uncharacterized protein n=1 Tax=Arundo donax TaxID=35708 RepID=A0A0A9GZH4_ARUDO